MKPTQKKAAYTNNYYDILAELLEAALAKAEGQEEEQPLGNGGEPIRNLPEDDSREDR